MSSSALKQGWTRPAIRWGVSILLLALVARLVPLGEVVRRLGQTDIALVLGSLLALLASLWIQAWRWKILMNEKRLSVPGLFGWTLFGVAAGFLLPSSVAGDMVKAYVAGRQMERVERSLMSTLLGRLLGMGSIAALAALGLLLWPATAQFFDAGRQALLAAVVLGGFAGLFVVGWYGRRCPPAEEGRTIWHRRAFRALHYLGEATHRPGAIAGCFALSLLLQSLTIVSGWLLFRASGSDVPLSAAMALLPIVLLGTLAPVSLGGIGVREGLTLALFSNFAGVPREICLASNVLGYAVNGLVALLGAAWWALARQRAGRQA